jgi:hypothetical protein
MVAAETPNREAGKIGREMAAELFLSVYIYYTSRDV